jgi:amidase
VGRATKGDELNEVATQSATWIAAAIRRRELSPVEALDACLERIESLDPDLNAIALPRFDDARREAREAEQALSRGDDVGPLHGVPFTVKEVIEVAGMPCTNASRIFEGNVSQEDAVVVENLRAAGAILIAKTNISELTAHYDSVNLVYGATRNPHDRSRSAGGSSGGEGVAVATAMTAFGIGSDVGGSIRIPASWDGVLGLKPGRGVTSMLGHFPRENGVSFQLMAEIGPLARAVEDLELLLPVLARPNPRDPDVVPGALRPVTGDKPRVAVFEEDGLQAVAGVCRDAVRRAADALSAAGYEIVEERPPNQVAIREAYDLLLFTDLAVMMVPQVADHEDELMPYMREMVEQLRGFPVLLERYVAVFDRLGEFARETSAWLERYPVALCPATPVPAPPLEQGIVEIDGQPPRKGGKMTLLSYPNALGLPAASVPAGRTPDGLPLAVQLFGRRRSELELLAVARDLEQALGGWLVPKLAEAA